MSMLLTIFAVTGSVLAGPARWAAAPPPPELGDLAFLVGAWVSDDGATSMREVWDPARGDAMVGHFSIVSEEHATLYELMTLERDGRGVTLRLRHFGPGLSPWASEADGALALSLVEVGEGLAVFEDPAREFPRRIVYTLRDGALSAELMAAPESEREAIVLTFSRDVGDTGD
ncbi:MAG: hypothetical protein IPJ41_02040 [Phycisphaerales bacterium]|nr:hypothetical protein [Phycisphaerales bacterium]